MISQPQDCQSITGTLEAGKAALTFFFGLMGKWGCSTAEQKVLLGSVGSRQAAPTHRLRRLKFSAVIALFRTITVARLE